MKSSYPVVPLKGHVRQISVRNKSESDVEVFSVTNSEGFTKSTDYFSKEVFSKDVSNYKVVSAGQFAYNPSRINVGSIDYLRCASKALVSPLYIVFETSEAIYTDYLLRYLKSNWGNAQIRANTEGAVRDSLKFKGLENIKIPLPSVDDQIRIALLLRKVEGLITQRKQNLHQLDELIKSVFLEMFGDPVRNEKGWDSASIEEFCSNIVDCPHSTPIYSDAITNYFCVRSSDIVNGYLDLDKTYQVDESVYLERIRRYTPEVGDIIYSREGGRLGNAARILGQEKICLGQRIMLFKVYVENTNEFLWAILESASFKFMLKGLVGGGAAPRVNIKDLKKIIVIKPPKKKQENFSNIVVKIDYMKSQYQQSLTELENLYGSLSQKAFKGELDLSRVPLPEVSAPKVHEVTLTDQISISDEVISIVEYPMSGPAEREKLLRGLFDEYLAQHKGLDLSLDDFWIQASIKTADMMDEFDKSWGVKDYDQVKQWLFEMINGGKIEQTQNIISEPDEDVVQGNELVLKALN